MNGVGERKEGLKEGQKSVYIFIKYIRINITSTLKTQGEKQIVVNYLWKNRNVSEGLLEKNTEAPKGTYTVLNKLVKGTTMRNSIKVKNW